MAKIYRRFLRVNGQLFSSPRFTRKRDAEDWYDQMKRKKQFMRDGFVFVDDSRSTTFIEYAQIWMQKRMDNYPKATWASDDQRLRDYILPKIGDIPIGVIKASQVKALLSDITEMGRATETRKRVQALLSTIFNSALNEDPPLVQYNPVTGIKFSEKRSGKKKPSFIDDANKCLTFIATAKELGTRHLLVASLGLMAGLRKSEMLGLKWSDIDFEKQQIHIRRRVEQVTLTVRVGTKKGEDETRIVPASSELFKVLSSYRKHSSHQNLNHFIFARESDGRFIGPRDLSKLHNEIVEKAQLKVTVHGLRHTFGREFAEKSGNMKALQAILGHASSTTTDLYSELSGKRLENFGRVVTFKVEP